MLCVHKDTFVKTMRTREYRHIKSTHKGSCGDVEKRSHREAVQGIVYLLFSLSMHKVGNSVVMREVSTSVVMAASEERGKRVGWIDGGDM